MKTLFTLLFLLPTLVFAGGPKLKNVELSKSELRPGESATITITLKGNAKSVSSMVLIVREFPYDVAPYVVKSVDQKKNRTWEAQIPVPYEAPPGIYNLELKISLEDGSQLISEDVSGNAHGKAATIVVTVL